MSTQQNAPNIALVAGAALLANRLIKANGQYQNGASTTRTHVGVSQDVVASGELATLRIPQAGTCRVTTDGAIAANASIYYGADGKVSTTSASNTLIGFLLEASSGDGSIVEAYLF